MEKTPMDDALRLMESQTIETTVDLEAAMALGDLATAHTLTASGDGETALDLGAGFAAQPVTLHLDATALVTTGGCTYQVEVKESTDGNTYTSTGLVLAVAATGAVAKVLSLTKRHVKLVWTIAGVTASVTYDASLALLEGTEMLVDTAFAETVLDLGEGFSPSPALPASLQLHVEALDVTAGNGYQAEVFESDDGRDFTTTGLVLHVTELGQVERVFGISKRYLKLAWTLVGETAAVTASAWINRA
jgi:hypothetical protein